MNASRKHYLKNTDKRKADSKERRRLNTVWYKEYKKAHSCKYCGEAHPACIDFHHRDPTDKEIDPGKMLSQGWSKERMLKELLKCDPVCKNCHAKLHWGNNFD